MDTEARPDGRSTGVKGDSFVVLDERLENAHVTLGHRTDHLSEQLDNLPARRLALKRRPVVKRRMVALIRELAPGFDDFEVTPDGVLHAAARRAASIASRD